MSLITRQLAGGLVVAEQGMDARAIERALKQVDERLILWPPDAMSGYWQVLSRVSDWQPPVPVTVWMDDYGQPLPLSSGLVDRVQRLRLDAPNKGPSVDEHNAAHAAAAERDELARIAAVKDEHRPYIERGRVSVGMGSRTRKRYWQRRSLPSRQER